MVAEVTVPDTSGGLTIALVPDGGGPIDARTLGRALLKVDHMLTAVAQGRDKQAKLRWPVTMLELKGDEVRVRIGPAVAGKGTEGRPRSLRRSSPAMP